MKNTIVLLSLFLINASSCKSKKVDSIPECIQEKILAISSEKVTNPPTKIYQYSYNDKAVYYVTSKCCDFFSTLYDADCNKLCSPDGGFTGKGDGKCTGFFDTRSDEKLIWEDERKQINKKK